MVELRTFEEGQQDSGGSDIEGILKSVWQNIQQDPQMQLKLAQGLAEQGIDPTLLGAVKPGLGEAIEKSMQEQAAEQATQQTPNESPNPQPEPEVRTVEKDVSVDQLIEFTEELIQYRGEDCTLGELVEFAEENPDVVQTAIDMKL